MTYFQPIPKNTAQGNKTDNSKLSEEPTLKERLLEMELNMMKANMEFMKTMLTNLQGAATGPSVVNTSKYEPSSSKHTLPRDYMKVP